MKMPAESFTELFEKLKPKIYLEVQRAIIDKKKNKNGLGGLAFEAHYELL